MEMNYALQYHPAVVREDIPALDAAWRDRIQQDIERKLPGFPDLFGKPLRRSLKGHRKLRVGDYRVVFRIQGSSVIILAILHRSEVYQRVQIRH
jgi:mRNA interferase RelE/StbE